MLSSVANAVYVWSQGVDQRLVLGGAGAFDVVDHLRPAGRAAQRADR